MTEFSDTAGRLPSEPRRMRDVPRFARETDVLVVGLGIAGACASIEASAAGADVLALERAGGGGGTSANSGGMLYLGGGTPVQRAAGFEDSPEEMFRFLVAVSQPGANEDKIRLFCEQSVEHFHWLEACGVPFKRSFHPEPGMEPPTDDGLVYSSGEDRAPYCDLARPAPRGHQPQVPGKGGPFLMQRMLEAVAETPCQVETGARVQTLVVDDDGAVVGAVVRSAGEEYCVRARRGVVLSAGGFVMNDAMRARHAPELARCKVRSGTDGDDGAGIRMGQGVGGDTVQMDLGEVALPYTIPHRLARGIYVNAAAQRFINEDTYYGHVGVQGLFTQGGQLYLLLDDATYERGLVGFEPTWVGETVGEVEREAGLPAGALVATAEFYNRHAAKGSDPLFHKRPDCLVPLRNPPFALVDCRVEHALWSCFTVGGLETNRDGAVLTPDGRAVPGLYAAGRTAAIFSGHAYPGSGTSLADGSFFGRRAGRAAAQG